MTTEYLLRLPNGRVIEDLEAIARNRVIVVGRSKVFLRLNALITRVEMPDYFSRSQFVIRFPTGCHDDVYPRLYDGNGVQSSANGTKVGGRRLKATAPNEEDTGAILINGSTITVGEIDFLFFISQKLTPERNIDSTVGEEGGS